MNLFATLRQHWWLPLALVVAAGCAGTPTKVVSTATVAPTTAEAPTTTSSSTTTTAPSTTTTKAPTTTGAPATTAAPAPPTTPTPPPPPVTEAYYSNCAAAKAAGAAPMAKGQPGYRAGLDGDKDGIACET